MKNRITFAVILAACLAAATVHAQTDYQSEGLSYGSTQLSPLHGSIATTNTANVPFYTSNPSQESEFGGPSLFNLGSAKISNCAASVPGSDQVANQECNAVNYLAKNPLQPYAISSTDPIITGIGATIKGAGSTVVGTGCTEVTTTTPASYTTETCNEYYVANNESCTEGEVVDVTAYSNFACDVTTEKVVPESCTDDVTCSLQMGGQCSPATFSCGPGSQSCCNFQLTCEGNAATLVYHDCCNTTSTTQINDVSQFFTSGVSFNNEESGESIICNQANSSCNINFVNYICGDPSDLSNMPGTNSPDYTIDNAFTFPGTVTATCTDTGGCSALDALSQ